MEMPVDVDGKRREQNDRTLLYVRNIIRYSTLDYETGVIYINENFKFIITNWK
jgi:hypothetical protein